MFICRPKLFKHSSKQTNSFLTTFVKECQFSCSIATSCYLVRCLVCFPSTAPCDYLCTFEMISFVQPLGGILPYSMDREVERYCFLSFRWFIIWCILINHYMIEYFLNYFCVSMSSCGIFIWSRPAAVAYAQLDWTP